MEINEETDGRVCTFLGHELAGYKYDGYGLYIESISPEGGKLYCCAPVHKYYYYPVEKQEQVDHLLAEAAKRGITVETEGRTPRQICYALYDACWRERLKDIYISPDAVKSLKERPE